jgi:hypothetical protein
LRKDHKEVKERAKGRSEERTFQVKEVQMSCGRACLQRNGEDTSVATAEQQGDGGGGDEDRSVGPWGTQEVSE